MWPKCTVWADCHSFQYCARTSHLLTVHSLSPPAQAPARKAPSWQAGKEPRFGGEGFGLCQGTKYLRRGVHSGLVGFECLFASFFFSIVCFHFCCERPQIIILLPQPPPCWDFRCGPSWLLLRVSVLPSSLFFYQCFLGFSYFLKVVCSKLNYKQAHIIRKPSQGQNNQYHCPHLVPLEGPKGRNTLGVVILVITMTSGIPFKRPA